MTSTSAPDTHAGPAGVITKVSPWSVSATVSRLVTLVESKGMKVFAVIDHSGEASYTAPSALASRYQLTDAMAARLAGIDALTDIVVNA